MARYHLSVGAEEQLAEILDWSEQHFGVEARDRYAALILAALRSVADDPRQANIHWRRFRKRELGVFHLENSRARVSAALGRVREPRHYVVFSLRTDGDPEILGFAHESMLLERVFRKLLSDHP